MKELLGLNRRGGQGVSAVDTVYSASVLCHRLTLKVTGTVMVTAAIWIEGTFTELRLCQTTSDFMITMHDCHSSQDDPYEISSCFIKRRDIEHLMDFLLPLQDSYCIAFSHLYQSL